MCSGPTPPSTSIIKLLDVNSNVKIIFSDIRFQDELDYIKKIGGKVLKVVRNNSNKNEYSNHISEKNIDGLNNIDYEVSNNESKILLIKKIISFLLIATHPFVGE